MTMGIAALGGEVVARIVKTIEIYDDFLPRERSVRRTRRSDFPPPSELGAPARFLTVASNAGAFPVSSEAKAAARLFF